MQVTLGFLALFLNLVGYVPYMRDILQRKVKPHRITWGVWAILTTIAAVNQIHNGGGYSSLFFVSAAFFDAVIFVLSLKYGMGGRSKIDRLCLILALLLLIYWVTIQDTKLSTVFAVIIDGIGAIPTLIKIYQNPKTETYIQWVLAAIAGALTIFAAPSFEFILIIYPAYVVLMNGAIVGVKFIKERKF